jgi:thymidine phosphorylase
LHLPAEETVFSAQQSGTISTMNTKLIGLANSELGCGRKELADVLDPTAGMEFYHKIGDQVTEGEPLIRLFNSNSEKLQTALTMLSTSVVIGEEHVDHRLFPAAD